MRRAAAPLFAACLAALAGCGDGLPDLDATLSPAARAAGYPALTPLDVLLAEATPGDAEAAAEIAAAMDARAKQLRRKARGLAGPVIPRAERRRLEAALQRHGG
jgi:hypothetical protein